MTAGRAAKALWALLAMALAIGLVPPVSAAKGRSVHIRGVAYRFEDPSDRPVGGVIGVAEIPGLTATVGEGGRYDLVVPDNTEVTPYIEAPGYFPIHLQTFVTSGHDLEHVNFQVPGAGVAQALTVILGADHDDDWNLTGCAIVSTFNTIAVRDLGFEDFVAHGAHGVAGATAIAEPALPSPTYFNEITIPDASLTESSDDGGIAWVNVPAGDYTIVPSHPTTRFAPFKAKCLPGRVVNAGPVWGLRELRADERPDPSVRSTGPDRRVGVELAKVRLMRAKHRLRVVLRATEPVSGTISARVAGRAGRRAGAIAVGRSVKIRPGTRRIDLRTGRKRVKGWSLRIDLHDRFGNRVRLKRSSPRRRAVPFPT